MLPESSLSSATVSVFSRQHNRHKIVVVKSVSPNHFNVRKPSLLFFCLLIGMFTSAQKVIPAANSQLTGITLPAGTKQDKRLLSVSAARILMESVSKKAGTSLKNTEVLYILPVASHGYTQDSLILAVEQAGWKISAVEGEKQYFWMEKDSRYVMAYFSTDSKETNLYFGESAQAPSAVGTTQTNQNVPQQNNTVTEQQNTGTQPEQQTQNQPQENIITPAVSSGFKYNTSNFDDGWTSTEQADWVEVTKGSIKVLLHYPKDGTIFPADPEPLTNAAWNILVAPRYSDLRNYKTAYINTYNRPYLGMGYATENATGKKVFIVFFRQGQTGWLEFIAPDKNSFVQQYKFDPELIRWDSDSDLMNPLANMTVYNKFAIAISDFKGKWTSDFTGIQQMYHVYTGQYAGMNINQSNEEFIFNAGGAYSWKLLAVNGMVGNIKYNEVKSSGRLTVPNNWQVHFSMIENRARTYHAFWSCIKGARILNLLDADYPGSGIYTKYGLSK